MMNTQKKIRVINIITPFKVVLNCGEKDGVKLGDKFLVYGIGPMLTDPTTYERLGELEIVRGKGIVTHIQERICTIESLLVEEQPKTIRRKQPQGLPFGLPAEETEIVRERRPFEDIQIGDSVRPIMV
jgi:hypothetical protein